MTEHRRSDRERTHQLFHELARLAKGSERHAEVRAELV